MGQIMNKNQEIALKEFKEKHSSWNIYINENISSSDSKIEQMSNGLFIRYFEQGYANEMFITSCSELLCG
jgi:hypothetical protein